MKVGIGNRLIDEEQPKPVAEAATVRELVDEMRVAERAALYHPDPAHLRRVVEAKAAVTAAMEATGTVSTSPGLVLPDPPRERYGYDWQSRRPRGG